MLANPYFGGAESWLEEWGAAYPEVPILGGLASSTSSEIFLLKDGEVSTAPVLAIAMKRGLLVRSLVSQGCRPIGDPSPITKAEQNLILEIGNLPAYQALEAAFLSIPAEQRVSVRNNLFLGLGRLRIYRGLQARRFFDPQHPGGRPADRRAGRGRSPEGGPDRSISIARFEVCPGRPRPGLGKCQNRALRTYRDLALLVRRPRKRTVRHIRTMTRKLWPTFWEIFLWQDSSVTERSGRSAVRRSSMGTPLRRRSFASRNGGSCLWKIS